MQGQGVTMSCCRFLSELSVQSDRIAKSSRSSSSDQSDWPQLATTIPDLQKQFPHKDAEAAATQGTMRECLYHMNPLSLLITSLVPNAQSLSMLLSDTPSGLM